MWGCPVVVGQRIEDVLQLDAPAIIAGAALLRDTNPLHSDAAVASASRFGSLIACGPHAAGLHACMLPTYVTRLGHGVVGVEFTLQYRRPILPDVPYVMWWEVSATEPRGKHWHVEWSGAVGVGDAESITGTGSILILET
jgi:acyl dehydratase